MLDDLYPEWDTGDSHHAPLSEAGRHLVLSVCPQHSRIVTAAFVRNERLPSPIRVVVETPTGERQTLYVRVDRHIGGVEREAALIPVLHQLGLPVPEVLAGPSIDPERAGWGPMIVLRALSGQDILSSVWNTPTDRLAGVINVTLDALTRVSRLTGRIKETAVAQMLPSMDLADELHAIVRRGGPWLDQPTIDRGIGVLVPIVEQIDVPLVFSSGDYNPGNLLWNGEDVTGFLDFAWACFEDPHVGYSKYWIYDWFPFNKAGLVERYLEVHGLTMVDFAPRLAVRCLWTLQREIPVVDTPGEWDYGPYRDRVMRLLAMALAALGQ